MFVYQNIWTITILLCKIYLYNIIEYKKLHCNFYYNIFSVCSKVDFEDYKLSNFTKRIAINSF